MFLELFGSYVRRRYRERFHWVLVDEYQDMTMPTTAGSSCSAARTGT